MNTSDFGAKVKLQALLDHTVSRILLVVKENRSIEKYPNLELVSKWGCDDASG